VQFGEQTAFLFADADEVGLGGLQGG